MFKKSLDFLEKQVSAARLTALVTMLFYHFFFTGVTFLSVLLLSWKAGARALGAYSLVNNWVALFLLVGTWGLNSYAIRELNRGQFDKTQVHRFAQNCLGTVLKLSLLTALVYGVVLWFYNTPLCQEHPFLVLFGGLNIVSGSVLNVSTGLLMGIHQPKIAQVGEKLIRPMLIFIFILLASFQLGFKLTDTSMMVFQFAGFAVASLYAIRRLFNELPLLNTSTQRASIELNLRSAGRLMFGTLFYLVYMRIDIIVLGWYYPTTYENIAYYNIALRFSELLLIPSSFLLSMFSAELCKLFFEGSRQPLQRLSNKIKVLQIAMVLAMALPILLFHRPILELFGKAFYLEGSLVLGLLCLVPILNALLGVFGSVLYLTHGEQYQYVAQGIGLVANVLGLYFLLPPMGIVGAAISVVFSTLVYLTALYLIGRQHFEQLK